MESLFIQLSDKKMSLMTGFVVQGHILIIIMMSIFIFSPIESHFKFAVNTHFLCFYKLRSKLKLFYMVIELIEPGTESELYLLRTINTHTSAWAHTLSVITLLWF